MAFRSSMSSSCNSATRSRAENWATGSFTSERAFVSCRKKRKTKTKWGAPNTRVGIYHSILNDIFSSTYLFVGKCVFRRRYDFILVFFGVGSLFLALDFQRLPLDNVTFHFQDVRNILARKPIKEYAAATFQRITTKSSNCNRWLPLHELEDDHSQGHCDRLHPPLFIFRTSPPIAIEQHGCTRDLPESGEVFQHGIEFDGPETWIYKQTKRLKVAVGLNAKWSILTGDVDAGILHAFHFEEFPSGLFWVPLGWIVSDGVQRADSQHFAWDAVDHSDLGSLFRLCHHDAIV